MGTSKSEEFNAQQNELAEICKALSHPARIAILEILIQKRACICGDIVDELPLSQSTVSQHLKELKASGLIKGEIEGSKVCYCIDEYRWNSAESLIKQFFSSYLPPIQSCC